MTSIKRNFIRLYMAISEYNEDGKALSEWIMKGKSDALIRRALAEYLLSTGFVPESMSGKPILVTDNRESEGSVIIQCVFHPECVHIQELFYMPGDLELAFDIPSSLVNERLIGIVEALQSDEDYDYLFIEHVKEPTNIKYM